MASLSPSPGRDHFNDSSPIGNTTAGMSSSRVDHRTNQQQQQPLKKSQMSQQERTLMQQVRCTRIACGCTLFLCLAWPALMVAGIFLMHTLNPQEEQLAELKAQSSTYAVARTAMQSTQATLATTTLQIEFDDKAVIGTSERSQYFQSNTRIVLTENHGPNHGVVAITMVYDKGRRTSPIVESPPVKLTIPASYDATCTIGASSVCGTRSCCTESAMQAKCQTMLDGSSTSAIAYSASEPTCFLGEKCGTCDYSQFLSSICFVVGWDSTNLRWARDTSLNSCLYPFTLSGQQYTDSSTGVSVFVRLKDDPFIVMQRLTKGTMQLAATSSQERAGGRGMLLCSILVLLMMIILILMIHICHFNVCDIIELRVMLGLPLSDRQVDQRRNRIAAKRDPDMGLAVPMTSKHTAGYLAQSGQVPPSPPPAVAGGGRHLRGGNQQHHTLTSPLSATRRLDFSPASPGYAPPGGGGFGGHHQHPHGDGAGSIPPLHESYTGYGSPIQDQHHGHQGHGHHQQQQQGHHNGYGGGGGGGFSGGPAAVQGGPAGGRGRPGGGGLAPTFVPPFRQAAGADFEDDPIL